MTCLVVDGRRFRPTLKWIIISVSFISNLMHLVVAILEVVERAPPALNWIHTLNVFPMNRLLWMDKVFYIAPDVIVLESSILFVVSMKADALLSLSVVEPAVSMHSLLREQIWYRAFLVACQSFALTVFVSA